MKKALTLLTLCLASLTILSSEPTFDATPVAQYFLDVDFNVVSHDETAQYVKNIYHHNGDLYRVELHAIDGRLKMTGFSDDPNGEVRTGMHIFFYDNGAVECEGEYRQGIKVGTWNRWDFYGNAKDSRFYSEDRWKKIHALRFG
ncbi:MAG: hypothetical protein HKN32_04995 [Flavobacteriales bacterium]|nr:hypothetical protein [Flavobacteriales bacterium]